MSRAGRGDEAAKVNQRLRNNRPAQLIGRSRSDMRARIAHLAARIMAEDGIEDYALAKKKAARQAGVADTRQLPGNDEIDKALRAYREIYHAADHHAQLADLREIAVRAMIHLQQFNPYLVGNVLSGIAGKYAGIQLQLFTDDIKAVELFLIDIGADYEANQTSLYSGETRVTVPLFAIDDDGVEIEIAVLSARDERLPLKTSLAGKAIERARLSVVEELMSQMQCEIINK